jgi:hypothetical protein
LLEADLKAPIPTSCSTCELHTIKNLKLAHYVDHLSVENDELRKYLSWLSGQEPQLSIMIAAYKRYDGQALGADKIGESSGERDEKIGEIPIPPHTTPKNKFKPKPNHLLNKLATTPDPPVFPPQTKTFQKPMRFVSRKGDVVGEKKGEKPSEQPQLKPKPKPIQLHCGYCGRDGQKDEFCFKRKCDERMAKEWANKDRYHPSHGVPEPRMPVPRGKAIVRSIPAWEDASSCRRGGFLERAVKPSRRGGQTDPPPEFWVVWFLMWQFEWVQF